MYPITMKSKFWVPTVCAILVSLTAGCGQFNSSTEEAGLTDTSGISTAIETDLWLGKWTGVEGTFLQLAGGKGIYEITIQNLDGLSTFQGKAVGKEIVFERNEEAVSIHATDGDGTGMKWLSGKTNCLTVVVGEGYCRS